MPENKVLGYLNIFKSRLNEEKGSSRLWSPSAKCSISPLVVGMGPPRKLRQCRLLSLLLVAHQNNGGTLFPKTPHALVAGLGKIKLVLTWKLPLLSGFHSARWYYPGYWKAKVINNLTQLRIPQIQIMIELARSIHEWNCGKIFWG